MIMNRLVYIFLKLLSTALRRAGRWLGHFVIAMPQPPEVTPEYVVDDWPVPPEHWLEHVRPQPPAHWLEYIQSRAPHLLASGFVYYASRPPAAEDAGPPPLHHRRSRQRPRPPQPRYLRQARGPRVRQPPVTPATHFPLPGRNAPTEPGEPGIYPPKAGPTCGLPAPKGSTKVRAAVSETSLQGRPPETGERPAFPASAAAVLIQPRSLMTRTAAREHRANYEPDTPPAESRGQPYFTPLLLRNIAVGRPFLATEPPPASLVRAVPRTPSVDSAIGRNLHQAGPHLRPSPTAVEEMATRLPKPKSLSESKSGQWAALIEEDDTSVIYSIAQIRSPLTDERHEQRLDGEQRGSLWNEWPF
jgi:hypothetical protein